MHLCTKHNDEKTVESNKNWQLLTPQWVAVELLKSKIKDQATHTIKPNSGSITVNTVTVLNRTRSPTFAMLSWNTTIVSKTKCNVEYWYDDVSCRTYMFVKVLVLDHAT